MCQLSRRASFDVREEAFARGWNEYFPRVRARKWQSNSVCRQCSLLSLCGSCPGANEMENGDVEALVPQFCEVTHLRAFAAMGESWGHRQDASCCLGGGATAGARAAAPAGTAAGCGSCGSHAEPMPALVQLQVARRR
jgi:radical SAM protein with 4Fe4S-binding SPASM domain